MTVFDTQMFINEVEKHEPTWKTNCKDYDLFIKLHKSFHVLSVCITWMNSESSFYF